MSKVKSHIRKGNTAQKTTKSPKQQVKNKSKQRVKIFVKGGLRDGHAGTSIAHQPSMKENGKQGKQMSPAKKTVNQGQRGKQTRFKDKKHSVKGGSANKSEKKASINGKQVDDGLSIEVKKAVTNLQASKAKASSNWEAFKEIGLHKYVEKPKSNSEFQGTFRKRIKAMKNANGPMTTIKDKPEDNKGDLNSLDLEDSYIKDLVPPEGDSLKELTKCIAIDCEMVGVGDGKESILARVSLVNQHGSCIYDKFVKPKEDVIDYRTKVSGVRPADLALGEELEVVQKEVAKIVEGRVLIGHALRHDLKVLFLSHPFSMTRDTSKFKPFKDMFNGQTPSLKNLSLKILDVSIQGGEHSSVEDAKATMQLYNLYSKEWEEQRRLFALRKHEKALNLRKAKNAGLTQNAQTEKDKQQTNTLRKKGLPGKSTTAAMVGINVLDEYMDC